MLRRKTCYDRLSVFQLYLVQLSSEREALLVHVLAFEQARRSAALWSIACAARPARFAACRRIILVQSNASQRARQLLTRQCKSARSRARPRHRDASLSAPSAAVLGSCRHHSSYQCVVCNTSIYSCVYFVLVAYNAVTTPTEKGRVNKQASLKQTASHFAPKAA